MPKVRPENGMQRNNPLKADKFTAFLTNFLDNCLKIRQFKKLLGKVPCKRDLFSASLGVDVAEIEAITGQEREARIAAIMHKD